MGEGLAVLERAERLLVPTVSKELLRQPPEVLVHEPVHLFDVGGCGTRYDDTPPSTRAIQQCRQGTRFSYRTRWTVGSRVQRFLMRRTS